MIQKIIIIQSELCRDVMGIELDVRNTTLDWILRNQPAMTMEPRYPDLLPGTALERRRGG